ncbi:MAG: 1,4-alpha-glucan branching protein domain-containing protein [Thermodesulfobacteriota bacterium]
MAEPLGYFTFVLHSHLPYVIGHGRWPHGMDWLNEAAAESYLPLLQMFQRLAREGRRSGVTLGVTPILAEMLAAPVFHEEFNDYLTNKVDAAREDRNTFARLGESHMAALAQGWQEHYQALQRTFREEFQEDLLGVCRGLMDAGMLEVITSAATHGYLPLLGRDTAVQAQVKQGVAAYRRHFGREPKGCWLPECAYRPRYEWAPPIAGLAAKPVLRKGVEEFLSENGLNYFIIDSHLLKGGRAIGVYKDRFEALERLWQRFAAQYQERPEDQEKSPYQVYLVSSAPETKRPVAAFTRDPKTGLQVWSGEWGYPGDGNYLDFHKKRFPGGLRYWRVTSAKADLADKGPYHPEWVAGRYQEQADHFAHLVRQILAEFRAQHGRPGIVVAPYDTELLGHWWFEGPQWLYQVLKRLHDAGDVHLTTGGAFLEQATPSAVISLPEGSWGEGGYHWIWLNDMNDWTWRHIYPAEAEMEELARSYAHDPDPRLQDLLKQCGRTLLLLEASDWQFLISTFSARDYAELRLVVHTDDFRRLAQITRNYADQRELSGEDWNYLELCQERDKIFPDLEPKWWARVEFPPEVS